MRVFDVKGMTCGHCVKAVTNAVHEVDADARVDVDLASGTVRVESKMSSVSIGHAIEEAGYETTERAT